MPALEDAINGELTAPMRELARARRRTDELFNLIPEALLFERPIAERHRLAFYLGHLEAFDVNLLLSGHERPKPVDSLDRLFAFGIDPTDGKLPQDRREDWPPLTAIRAYARRTRARLDLWLDETRVRPHDAQTLTQLQAAIEHRWMHAETLAYLLNRLPLTRPIRNLPAYRRESDHGTVEVEAGEVLLGSTGGFAWDNELAAHRISLPAFRIDRHMVTNGQFLRFMEVGGYAERRYWSAEDWQWRTAHEVEQPAAWQRGQREWLLYSRADLIPLQAEWPVYVSHAEATAYARWAGRQLPTEAQWQRAAYGDGNEPYPWGDALPDTEHGNFDFAGWDPAPVDAHPRGASACGALGMLGNGWEWTRSVFAPFRGFRAMDFYPGYSADFFDGRHFVLKGGSPHTALGLLRRSFRNWFQPHYQYVFAGFRCVDEP
ncbi:MAG: SUMF1/EgtB/PvdO family nonheme iron enzyme [Steroidobacteraceae bacterium]